MANFDFYKKIKANNLKVKKRISKLHDVYKAIPDTKGCMENINAEGGCRGWCCKCQSPQLLYSEFLLIWNHISKELSNEEFLNIMEKALLNAVDDKLSKGCIFFDDSTYLCKIHKVRPMNCIIYGITPEEEFNERFEKLKKEYEERGEELHPQCSLISTVNGEEITTKSINKWWQDIAKIESKIGIRENKINDDVEGGSYRSPHDHLILYVLPENIIFSLAAIRLYDKWDEKEKAIKNIMDTIRKFYNG